MLADSEPASDVEQRHPIRIQADCFGNVHGGEGARAAQRHRSASEVRGDRATVSTVLLRDLVHAQAALVEFHDPVDLGLGEEGLSFPNRPDDPAPIVSNRGFQGALARVVDPALPPRGNSFQGWGKVLKVSTREHR